MTHDIEALIESAEILSEATKLLAKPLDSPQAIKIDKLVSALRAMQGELDKARITIEADG